MAVVLAFALFFALAFGFSMSMPGTHWRTAAQWALLAALVMTAIGWLGSGGDAWTDFHTLRAH